MDNVISHFSFNKKHNDKCKFALNFLPLVTTSNLFSLEVVQKCQHCQLFVLRENSIGPFKLVSSTEGQVILLTDQDMTQNTRV